MVAKQIGKGSTFLCFTARLMSFCGLGLGRSTGAVQCPTRKSESFLRFLSIFCSEIKKRFYFEEESCSCKKKLETSNCAWDCIKTSTQMNFNNQGRPKGDGQGRGRHGGGGGGRGNFGGRGRRNADQGRNPPQRNNGNQGDGNRQPRRNRNRHPEVGYAGVNEAKEETEQRLYDREWINAYQACQQNYSDDVLTTLEFMKTIVDILVTFAEGDYDKVMTIPPPPSPFVVPLAHMGGFPPPPGAPFFPATGGRGGGRTDGRGGRGRGRGSRNVQRQVNLGGNNVFTVLDTVFDDAVDPMDALILAALPLPPNFPLPPPPPPLNTPPRKCFFYYIEFLTFLGELYSIRGGRLRPADRVTWAEGTELFQQANANLQTALTYTDSLVVRLRIQEEHDEDHGGQLSNSDRADLDELIHKADAISIAAGAAINNLDTYEQKVKNRETVLFQKLNPQWQERDQVKERWGQERWTTNPNPKMDYAERRALMEKELEEVKLALQDLAHVRARLENIRREVENIKALCE
jgi:hypothetical protein